MSTKNETDGTESVQSFKINFKKIKKKKKSQIHLVASQTLSLYIYIYIYKGPLSRI